MRFPGDRRRVHRRWLAALGAFAVGAACSSGAQTGSQPASDAARASAQPVAQPRVGNPSNTGMDTVPDWDAMARDLRMQVGPRLPDPLPTQAEPACEQMLDAARDFYTSTEINPEHQKRRRAELAATRDADMSACVAQTSVAAATCVTILLGDRDSEFPWLLDQCSRAFPRE